MSDQELRDKFIKYIDNIKAIRKKVNFSLAITNQLEERQKFFAIKNYNPQLQYKALPLRDISPELTTLARLLKQEKFPIVIQAFIESQISSVNDSFLSAIYKGKPEIFAHSQKLYTYAPLGELYKEWVRLKPEQNNHLLEAEEILRQFKQLLTEKGLASIAVSLSREKPNRIWVIPSKIHIGVNMRKSQLEIDRLLVHEIQTHLYMNLNLAADPSNILARVPKSPQSLEKNEGMAIYNEIAQQVITNSAKLIYALRATVDYRLSFNEIYKWVLPYLSEESIAYDFTLRIKRGLSDTTGPGGYTRDRTYYNGYMKLQDKLSQNIKLKEFFYMTNVGISNSDLFEYNLVQIQPKYII